MLVDEMVLLNVLRDYGSIFSFHSALTDSGSVHFLGGKIV